MTRRFPLLPLAALCLLTPLAQAADLRLYPTFGEVTTQPLKVEGGAVTVPFPGADWAWVVPGSVRLLGVPVTRTRVMPGVNVLRAHEGEAVRVLRGGLNLRGTLVDAEALLVQLDSGEFLKVRPDELALSTRPLSSRNVADVKVRFETGSAGSGKLLYQTRALSWKPRYELDASGGAATLRALAEIRNAGEQAFAGSTDLYAGDVRLVPENVPMPAYNQSAGTATAASVSSAETTADRAVLSLGEVRGLQRYALGRPLNIGPFETQTLPFLTPKLAGFTRYDRISTYFSPQNSSGRATRFYKFTADAALPAGPLTVREDGVLFGTVSIGATAAGQLSDLALGADPELRYSRTVATLNTEKNPAGRVLSRSYRVSFSLASTKSAATKVQVREQIYGQNVVVDGQSQGNQSTVTRSVQVPAGGKASVTFTVKVQGG
ncbi:hypothetical protein [Deinococcus sp. PESE-13]